MPLPVTAGELAILNASRRNEHFRVEVADGVGGTWYDLTSWIQQITVTDTEEAPTMSATFSFIRDKGVGALTNSLAPFMAAISPVPGGIPILRAPNPIRLWTAITLPGVAPVAGDWKNVYDGKIDDVNWAQDPITVESRDRGAYLLNEQIQSLREYGDDVNPVPLEVVSRQLMDDNGWASEPLEVPVTPNLGLGRFRQDQVLLLDALRATPVQIGWSFRLRHHDASGTWRQTLYEVNRAKTVPDHTIPPGHIFDVNRLNTGDVNVRNWVRVWYVDVLDGKQKAVEQSDAGSIALHLTRFSEIVEADTSRINTAVEAQRLADAYVADLAIPGAEQVISMRYWWPIVTGDLHRYLANGKHYDSDQDWAVWAWTHTIAPGQPWTTEVSVRGKPTGYYAVWLEKEGKARVRRPNPVLGPPLGEEYKWVEGTKARDVAGTIVSDEGQLHYPYWMDYDTESIEIQTAESPFASIADPPDSLAWSSGILIPRPEGTIGRNPTFFGMWDIAVRTGWYRRTRARGRKGGTWGDWAVHEFLAADTGAGPVNDVGCTALTVVQTASSATLAWTYATGNDPMTHGVRLFRNGAFIAYFPPGSAEALAATWVDQGLPTGRAHRWEIDLIRNGQTTCKRADNQTASPTPTAPPPTLAAPTWAAGMPSASETLFAGSPTGIWTLRTGFGNLLPGAVVFVEVSTNGGANWYPFGNAQAQPTSIGGFTFYGAFVQQTMINPAPGTYSFRAYQQDTNAARSGYSTVQPVTVT